MSKPFLTIYTSSVVALLLTQTALADGPPSKADKAAEKADNKADVAADKAAAEKSGNDAVVNGNSLTDKTRNGPAERFGRQGEIAISSDTALTISSTSVSGASGSTTNIELEPALDYFVIDNLSIGGFLQFNYTSASDGHGSTVGIGPRVGYNFALSDLISVWPRAGLSIDHTDTTATVTATGPAAAPGTTVSTSVGGTSVALNLFVPLMFHPAKHFFAGFGPFLDTDLSGDPRATTWGGKLTVGGWLL